MTARKLNGGITRRDTMRLGLGSLVAAGALGRISPALAQGLLQWGSSSIGSTGYVIIEALAATVNRHSELQNAALATAGGAENMALLGEGLITFGQTTSTDWLPATTGAEPYGQPIDVNQVFAYTVFNCTPMVRADSEIQTLEDLRGKRVMPSTAGGSTAVLFRTLFEAAGIVNDVEWTYGSWRETYDALRAGAVDCIPSLLTNSRPSPIQTELTTTLPIRILPLSRELLQQAQDLNPGVIVGELEPEKFDAIDEMKLAASFSGILATRPETEEEIVYQVTKAVYDNAEEVRGLGVQLQDIEPKFATRYLLTQFPVHPGAARYFKEIGVWRDDLTVAG